MSAAKGGGGDGWGGVWIALGCAVARLFARAMRGLRRWKPEPSCPSFPSSLSSMPSAIG